MSLVAAATEHPQAVAVAEAVLRSGGTAADAIVAAVVAHCAVCAGTSTLAGTMSVVYHDGPSGVTHVVDAGCTVPYAEAEPWDFLGEAASARSVLVPGVVAGLGALWQRFGRTSWRQLVEPAIAIARDGYVVYPQLVDITERYREKLTRHESGRAVMLVDGDLPKVGTNYRQPALADTLDGLADEGWAYFYGGDWGRSLVDALRADGSRMTIEDLERYEVRWEEPLRGSYLDFEVRTNVPPQLGGAVLLAGLGVAEALRIHERPRRDADAATLADEIRTMLATAGPTGFFGLEPFRVDLRHADAVACDALEEVLSRGWAEATASTISSVTAAGARPVGHSHTLVVADAEGSCAALTHTVHGNMYGDCGIVVGGVHLNGSASTIPGYDFWPGPGGRICEALSADVVVRDGRPVMAATGIGVGLHAAQLQNHIDVLGRGDTVADAVASRRFGSYGFLAIDGSGGGGVFAEAFEPAVLDEVEAAGLPLERRDRGDGPSFADAGLWSAVTLDDGKPTAVSDPRYEQRLTLP